MNVNPFLVLLALALGFLYSWQFVVVKKVTRGVPADTLPDAAGAASIVPGAAGAAAAGPAVDAARSAAPSAWAPGADTGWDMRPPSPEQVPSGASPAAPADPAPLSVAADSPLSAAADSPLSAAAAAASGLARQARDWLGRLDEAKDRLVGAAAGRTPPESERPDERETHGSDAPAAVHSSGLPAWTDPPADGATPEGYTIKGDRKAQLYLAPGDPDYDRARPDIWFVGERAALDAGYAHYVRKPKRDAG